MNQRSVSWLVGAACGLAIGLLATSAPTSAREGYDNGRPLVCDPADLGEGTKELKDCQIWIAEALIPPARRSRCCGEGDAYIVDAFRTREDGAFVAIITVDYPVISMDDGEGGTISTRALPKGTEIVIPPDKHNNAALDGGNPSGHGVLFMSPGGDIYCYFSPTLV